MSETNWLTDLTVGDEVGVCHTGLLAWYEFRRVVKRTRTQIVVGATRYRAEDGRECGDRYRSRLEQATPELKQQEAEKKQHLHLRIKLDSVRWRDLPLATLRAVDALLESKARKE